MEFLPIETYFVSHFPYRPTNCCNANSIELFSSGNPSFTSSPTLFKRCWDVSRTMERITTAGSWSHHGAPPPRRRPRPADTIKVWTLLRSSTPACFSFLASYYCSRDALMVFDEMSFNHCNLIWGSRQQWLVGTRIIIPNHAAATRCANPSSSIPAVWNRAPNPNLS